MKRQLLYILFLFLSLNGFTQISQNHYLPGEKLKFVLFYGLVNGGYVNVELRSVQYEGKNSYQGVLVATTSGLADIIYKVRDEYQSYFDPGTSLPYKAIRDISEGKYKRYDHAFFDNKNLKVTNNKNKVFVVPPDIRDIIAVFYYIRNTSFEKMKPGDIMKVNTFFDNEIYALEIVFQGTELIDTKKGQFQCYKIVPYVATGRAFENEDDMTIYLSADRNRVPVRVEFNLKVGSIKCDLIEYSGLKY
jgi:hypothetical protein